MPLTASQIIDMHTDLRQRMDYEPFVRYLALCYTTSHEATPGSEQVKAAEWAVNSHLRHITMAYAYRVTAEMMDLLRHAASVLDPTDEFDHQLAPTACGIVRFDTPIEVTDIRSRTLKTHWLVWGPAERNGKPVTLMSWYNDATDPDDYSFEYARDTLVGEQLDQARKIVGRWMWNGAEFRADGVPMGDPEEPISEELAAQVRASGDEPSKTTNLPRYVHALWLLLNQTITETREEFPDRAAIKRANRMRLPSKVTTIRLRRSEASRQPGESTVEWRHRWIVRGHWRWQAYGTGRKDRRRIWIAPFVKGPAGAPLIDRPKLYDLSR